MDNELTTIIHGQYKIQDDSNKYNLVLYPENSTDDIVIGSLIVDLVISNKEYKNSLAGNYNNLSELLIEIIDKLNNSPPVNVAGIAEDLETANKVYDVGQFIYEKDTNKLRCGDGVTPYSYLPYLAIITNPE